MHLYDQDLTTRRTTEPHNSEGWDNLTSQSSAANQVVQIQGFIHPQCKAFIKALSQLKKSDERKPKLLTNNSIVTGRNHDVSSTMAKLSYELLQELRRHESAPSVD